MGKTYPEHLFLHLYFFSPFWRQHALLHAPCPHSALRSFPLHAKIASPPMKVGCVLKRGAVPACTWYGRRTRHTSACPRPGEARRQRRFSAGTEPPVQQGACPVPANFHPAWYSPLLSFHSSSCHSKKREFGQAKVLTMDSGEWD